MCGICGFFDPLTTSPRAVLEAMTQSLAHRGPDDLNIWLGPDQSIGLGHTRLSVIDLERGQQPMHSMDGRYVIVFNGEIYNYRVLRQELEKSGHSFSTDSDTEVLLEAYRRWGQACLERLHGMFAFALFDRVDQSLFLARDRTGIKPLYYHRGSQGFFFGSELKAVLAITTLSRRLHYPALVEFLVLSYPTPPRTFFEDIHELEPGSWIQITKQGMRQGRYWTWSRQVVPCPEPRALELTEQALIDSLGEHLTSDVPIGAFLSGGIDSSLLIALLAKVHHRRLPTFAVAFDAVGYDESAYARLVAATLGTEHCEITVKSGDGDLSLLDRILDQFDQPFGDSSAIPTFLISQEARKSVKVVIGGDGGDEMFGEYRRFHYADLAQKVGRLPQWSLSAAQYVMKSVEGVAPSLSRQSRRFLTAAAYRDRRRVLALSCYTFPGDLSEILRPHAMERTSGYPAAMWSECGTRVGPGGPEFVDVTMARALPGDYLRKVDMMSSAHGLEVRLPFLGERVLDWSAKLPYALRSDKGLLRSLVAKYLPREISNKPKGGFGIPFDSWLGEEGRKEIQSSLLAPSARILDLIDATYVRQLLSCFAAGDWEQKKMSRYNLYQRVYFLWALERWLTRWKPLV